jgi:hypothetical protein
MIFQPITFIVPRNVAILAIDMASAYRIGVEGKERGK